MYMKIYIPNESKQSIGGGWTFLRNFKKALPSEDSIVGSVDECDILFIVGATMTPRSEVERAKQLGKKVVFRVDNIPKDSRNRGTAFSRMLDFARLSDYVIFQSKWAMNYVGWWFEHNGIYIGSTAKVIYNGVDPDFFYEKKDNPERNVWRYLVVQYNRDENKRIPEAFYNFHMIHRTYIESSEINPELWIVGQFSPELVQYNFDFFAGEQVKYLGVVDDPAQMGDIYRSCGVLLFPAYADASPNTVMEARACGCYVQLANAVGGTHEVLGIQNRTIYDMVNDYKSVFSNIS